MNPLSRVVRQVRIGLFLAGSILVLIIVLLLLGRSQALFRSRVTLFASFANTSGLVVGSPVRLAGVDVGAVQNISLEQSPSAHAVTVTLKVDESYLPRIRQDSVATMTTRGLLGDMIVNITLGSPSAPPLQDGDHITTHEAQGLREIIESVEVAVSTVKSLTQVVDERLKMVLTEDLARDVGRIAHSTANLAEQIEHGHGLAHDVLYDKRLSQDVSGVLAGAKKSAEAIDRSVENVEHILAQIEHGDGILHALVYTRGGAETVEQLKRSAAELDAILAEVRTGHGLIHSVIYEKDETNLIENLTKASALIKRMAEEIDQGKGTIGGLVKDPTIYQDLMNVLGEVKRNVILKALIRLTIKKDNLERPTP
jgi:phospholipid/cholesterol/gamma-HCH transport system substrate-binding protein